MDKQPTQIQREIEAQRQVVGEKLAVLRDRLQSDAGNTRSAFKRQSSRAGQQVKRGMVFTGSALGLAAALGAGYTVFRRIRRKQGNNSFPLEVRVKKK